MSFDKDLNGAAEEGKEKTPCRIRRDWLEKGTADAQKATLKAKETEAISLTLPEK